MTSDKFKVTWEAQDGYIGGSRPQTFNIHEDDLEDDMDEQDIRQLFWDAVQNDMEQKISADTDDEDKFVEWAKSRLAERTTE